jgi:hypothetical protein
MNEHVGEDAELFALGVLDEAERARVEAHAAVCADCAKRLGEAEAVVAGLALSYEASQADAPARGRVRLPRGLAAAAAVFVALGITLGALFQTQRLSGRVAADDAVLATLATSHFNHAQFVAAAPGAPVAKLLNARHGEWLYVIVDAPADGLRVVAARAGSTVDLGAVATHGRTSTLFVRDPGTFERVDLERGGSVVETATPSYKDE